MSERRVKLTPEERAMKLAKYRADLAGLPPSVALDPRFPLRVEADIRTTHSERPVAEVQR